MICHQHEDIFFKLLFELLVVVFDGIENLKSIILDKITCDEMWPWTVMLEWLLKISVVILEWLFAVSQRTFLIQTVYFEMRCYVDDVHNAVKWQLYKQKLLNLQYRWCTSWTCGVDGMDGNNICLTWFFKNTLKLNISDTYDDH